MLMSMCLGIGEVAGTIYDAAQRFEAYLHGQELRTVESFTSSSGAQSKAITQPQTRHTSPSHSMVPTILLKTIPEDDLIHTT